MEDRRTRWFFAIVCLLSSILTARAASANPTQEEVFKSIQDNVGQSTDPRKFFAFLAGTVALILLLTVLSNASSGKSHPRR